MTHSPAKSKPPLLQRLQDFSNFLQMLHSQKKQGIIVFIFLEVASFTQSLC